MTKPSEGWLLIADITGYTHYLSESELEHAQETLTALLELLVDQTRPPLVISRLEGDAVISYGLREGFFEGQTFVEKIEDTYIEFRRTLERLVLNNTCRCNACANIDSLDLKFFIHYGTFGIQNISGHHELVGSDINLLHRLVKNSVTEETGFQAYALYTESALRQFNQEDLAQGMTRHSEKDEHLGRITVLIQDMRAVWEKRRAVSAVTFPHDQTLDQLQIEIRLTREQVWNYMVQPEFRATLIGTDRMEISNRAQGRIAPGSIYQCYHGDKWVPQTILGWQPFERMIVKELMSMFPSVSFLSEYRLDPSGDGTRLTIAITRPSGPLAGRILARLMLPIYRRRANQDIRAFARRIEAEARASNWVVEERGHASGKNIRNRAAKRRDA